MRPPLRRIEPGEVQYAPTRRSLLNATRAPDDVHRLLHKAPHPYSPELAERICIMVSIGMSFPAIAEYDDMPSVATMLSWKNTNEQFRAMYHEACEARSEYWAEELLRLSDAVLAADQVIDPKTGRTMVDPGLVQAARMKSENVKWLLSKLDPGKYGEEMTLRHAGHDGGPLILPRTFNLDALPDELLHQLTVIVAAALPTPQAAPVDDPEAGSEGEGGT